MSNFNKNLNAFAEKLKKFHISNNPTVHNIRTRKGVQKTSRHAKYSRKNTNQTRKTVKSRRLNTIAKRRKTATLLAKQAKSEKAKTARAQKKAENAEKAKTLILSGRTRGQTKALAKNANMK